ncbi:MAG: glycosyltransferase family 4 protein, partial [Candidatus Buchananbacteria bacterium]|nr:glycosyltransferase family 4 protein [Candidatus Buchananbacteria bacterium]
ALPQKFKRKKILLQKILSRAKNIIANSNFTKQEILKLGIDEQKIVIVNPGPNITPSNLDLAELAEIKNKYQLNGKKVILSVGRLVRRKGFDLTIEAVAQIVKTRQDFTYLIVGNGPDFMRLEKIIVNKKAGQFVRVINQVDDQLLAAYYQACDFLVMPARQIDYDFEGFGIVYLEANGFGKPVIGAKSGGVAEAIIDGQTGFLIEPDNLDQLVEKINQFLNQPDLAKKLGLQGLQRVIDDFDWQKIVAKIKLILN